MNVLVIPEDFRKDQYVLKPIIEKLLAAVPLSATVRVCQDPLLAGVHEATRWERIEEIFERYRGMVRLFLLIVDRDGDPHRRTALDNLEQRARESLTANRVFLAENAWQEIEVWVLAGMQDLPSAWAWADVRADVDPKEHYYNAYASRLGQAPYGGRDVLAREAAGRYGRIRQLCPEDVARLEQRVRDAFVSS